MASSKQVVIAALTGNGLIAAAKFVAASITGSSAMFSEAIHSVADTGSQALLIVRDTGCRMPAGSQPFRTGRPSTSKT